MIHFSRLSQISLSSIRSTSVFGQRVQNVTWVSVGAHNLPKAMALRQDPFSASGLSWPAASIMASSKPSLGYSKRQLFPHFYFLTPMLQIELQLLPALLFSKYLLDKCRT